MEMWLVPAGPTKFRSVYGQINGTRYAGKIPLNIQTQELEADGD